MVKLDVVIKNHMVCASAMHERYDDEKHAGGKNVCTKGYFEN